MAQTYKPVPATNTNKILGYCMGGELLVMLTGTVETTSQTDTLIQTIIQVLIGIATIYKIIKQKREDK